MRKYKRSTTMRRKRTQRKKGQSGGYRIPSSRSPVRSPVRSPSRSATRRRKPL